MSEEIEVSVHQVNEAEIDQLHTAIVALRDESYHEYVTRHADSKRYVIVVERATCSKLKEVLWSVLRYVRADRIDLGT